MTPYAASLFEPIRMAMEAGGIGEATALLRTAVASGADDGFFLYVLGNCQFKSGDYADAARSLGASTRLEPSRAEAFNDLAAALFVLGRDAEALTCLRRALDLRPDLAVRQPSAPERRAAQYSARYILGTADGTARGRIPRPGGPCVSGRMEG
jgi:tetratricopeptide (TPR) repeat protein